VNRHDWAANPNSLWYDCTRCNMSKVKQAKGRKWRYYLNEHPSSGGGWVSKAGPCKKSEGAMAEPSKRARDIVLGMLHGLHGAEAIDAYAAERVSEERRRCSIWTRRYLHPRHGLVGQIESSKWPEGVDRG
jgi:hypothetical protein